MFLSVLSYDGTDLCSATQVILIKRCRLLDSGFSIHILWSVAA